MVGIAQLVEHLVVVQGAAGSSPVTHPNANKKPLRINLRGFVRWGEPFSLEPNSLDDPQNYSGAATRLFRARKFITNR